MQNLNILISVAHNYRITNVLIVYHTMRIWQNWFQFD